MIILWICQDGKISNFMIQQMIKAQLKHIICWQCLRNLLINSLNILKLPIIRKEYHPFDQHQMSSTVKSNFSKPQYVPSTNYPLKKYSSLNMQQKSHRQMIKKIAQPFICYKHHQSQQQQLNIAGYKTSGLYLNKAVSGQQYTIPKESVEKYMFTFCFQIGSDLPSDEQIKLIYSLLVAHSKSCRGSDEFTIEKCQGNDGQSLKMSTVSYKRKHQETVKKPSLYLLIRICLQIYIKAKQSSIGGIIERVIIGIRKEIQTQQENNQSLSSSKAQETYA